MKLSLAGYETKPQKRFQQELISYSAKAARGEVEGMPPTSATPVFADENGRHFMGMPTDDGLMTLPFIPGSPASDDRGGFVAASSLPKANNDDLASVLSGVGAAIPPQTAAAWLDASATNAALAGAPGTPLAAALASLGMPNPMAAGALGGAVAVAANMAGLGRAGSLLSGALGGGPQGLANALGAQALSGLIGRTPLGSIPGMGALAGMAGGQLGNLANMLCGDGWGAGLNQAAGMLGGLLGSSGGGLDPSMLADNIVEGGCTKMPGMDPASGAPDLGSIGAQALEGAADKLLNQWQVDDESSAAEHIAHKLVNDNRDILKEAARDPDGLLARLEKLFTGETSAAALPAARLKDADVTKPEIVARGVATILAEGQPISRITDPLAPSGALILEGAATVLSAGLPTARVTSRTDSPGVMIDKGAPSVLVGGPTQPIDPPEAPPEAETPSNKGPANPDAPKTPGSGSASPSNDDSAQDTGANSGSSSSQAGTPGTPEDDTANAPGTEGLPVREGGLLGGDQAEMREAEDVYTILGIPLAGSGPVQGPEGCGSDGSGWVPDWIGPFDFREACDQHDVDWTNPESLNEKLRADSRLGVNIIRNNYEKVNGPLDAALLAASAFAYTAATDAAALLEAAKRATSGRNTPSASSPPPRNYHLPGETSPRNPHFPEGPGNVIYH